MEEQQAITRLKQADLFGLEFLVKQYQARAVQTAYLIIGDAGVAEDVVQTIFLRLPQKIHQFDDQRAFHSWFFRIVVNGAIKEARRLNRTVSLDESSDSVLNRIMDTSPRPEEQMEMGELRTEVWNAIQQLTPEQRAVIVQRHFLDMSEAEMVDEMQRPASTVKWWLHTARGRLRELLRTNHKEPSVGEPHEKR